MNRVCNLYETKDAILLGTSESMLWVLSSDDKIEVVNNVTADELDYTFQFAAKV
jgi:hypothetical protein